MTKSTKKRLRESAGAGGGARASPGGVDDKVTAATAATATAKAEAKAKGASPPSIRTLSTAPAELGGSATPSSATDPGVGGNDDNINRDDRVTWSKSKKKKKGAAEAACGQRRGGI